MSDEEFPELPPSPWFLPGSRRGVFCLGGSADRSTWHKRTFCGCRRVFVASFLFTLICLPLFNHQFSSGKTKRWRRPDFLTWNTCCSGFDGQVLSLQETAPGTFQHLFRNWGNLPGGRMPVTMKVTVTFGDTSVVVPCKTGWTVRDLIDQATRRYRRILEQVNTEHALMSEISDYFATEIQKQCTLLSSRSFPYFKSTITLWGRCASRDFASWRRHFEFRSACT